MKKSRILRKVSAGLSFIFWLSTSMVLPGCGPPEITERTFVREVEAGEQTRFAEKDRELIRDYYDRHRFDPALAKPSILAPDLAQRIEKTAKMPPGLGGTPLPWKLEKKSSPPAPEVCEVPGRVGCGFDECGDP